MKPISKKRDDLSVLSGRTMNQLSRSNRVWPSRKTNDFDPVERGHISLPTFVKPMKAKFVKAPPTGDWSYEIKFDGWRALALKGGSQARLVSRNETEFSEKFPEIISSLLHIKAKDAILDGEIVALNAKGISSFQLLQAYDIGNKRPPIYFYAFDLLQLNGKDLKSHPLEKRKALLKSLKLTGTIRFSASLGGNAKLLLKKAQSLGLEGLIGKKCGSHYEAGARSGTWIKLKLLQEQEFVIGGYTDPKGTRPYFGALVVGYYHRKKLMYAGKVGTGFNMTLIRSIYHKLKTLAQIKCPFTNLQLAEESPLTAKNKAASLLTKKELKSCHWVKPILVCQLKFNEWTNEGHLRQPVFLGLLEDKAASEVISQPP